MSTTPRSLIVSVYGLYARAAGGVLPVSGLVRLLSTLDVDEQAVRAAVSRLKRRGMLASARVDGAAGYALTDTGRGVLDAGDARIFHPRQARSAEGWVLCVFSVPETLRAKRHVLRGRLTWLGFGQAAPGVWIAPAHVFDTARAVLREAGLGGYVSLFTAEYYGDQPAAEAVRTWWDLPKLAAMYQEFIDDHSTTDGDPIAAWVAAVTDWRRLPFLDPGLPAELLPPDWPGHRAAELFHDLEHHLSTPAARRARELLGVPVGATT
ncbi:MAG TPA: PaaX family transcriptional regulator C-terminal domain-containing protein [Stackebrandtia sp.]|uniref:PaaX family transcriptional regulator n=1 Tax=Stackebrandtia sp. TaxID=2023065 RepID=UPI002D64796D|nr:PaaX family transcriptional regulator C-terminal domain-containing protein [Stackebrandtia sp.]HZE41637.1 PaaX family transcriptional regulator C-terminal domain-containing protein [Stackebrandtia sp.]